MIRLCSRLKLLPLLLIAAILCASCEVPDITEFTKQSAEMTRGIRTGVKDTEGVIKTASERPDLFLPNTQVALRKNLKDYRSAMKPTIEALDALDGYLEALNALAQANKKSEENSRGVVTAVTNLVSAVSGFTFASATVNVATGLLTLAEQFRTARSFKKRVNLASVIVEGGFKPKIDSSGNPVLDKNGDVVMVKACTGRAEDRVTRAGARIKELVDGAIERLTDEQRQELEPLAARDKRQRLAAFKVLTDAQVQEIGSFESELNSYSCGVIDLLKFNVKDLKAINLSISTRMLTNAREKNRTVLGFYDAIEKTDRRVQRELQTILNYQTFVAAIRELEATGGSPQTIALARINIKHHLDQLFADDGQLRNQILQAITDCRSDCGDMLTFLEFDLCETCGERFRLVIDGISRRQFDASNGRIEGIVEQRAAVLYEQNSRYLEELKRITPAHSAVIAELKSMDQKQTQLDQLLDTSVSALDAWSKTHANLRVAVNTKKPLTVAQLASKVREIWSIINPETD